MLAEEAPVKMRSPALVILALLVLTGSSVKPISRTIDTVKRVYHTTGKVYQAGKAVSDLVNPLELVFVSDSDDAWDTAMPCGPDWCDVPGPITVSDPDTGDVVGVIDPRHP